MSAPLPNSPAEATRSNPRPSPPEQAIPPFEPPRWLRSANAQTIVARFWSWPMPRLESKYAEVDVGDGDRVSVLDSIPDGWPSGGPAALLVHGLAGCARSPYMIRVGKRLYDLGIRVVRMNLRGAGSGFGLARSFYHSGRTDDVRNVAEWIARRGGGGPLMLVGFSLGANLVLKLAGEAADRPVEGLDSVAAANPPLDLEACCRLIQEPHNWFYDRNFVKLLRAEVHKLHRHFPDLEAVDLKSVRSLLEFDEAYTAPRNGFAHALDYYRRSSAGPFLPLIRVPGLVIHAEDDPFIPAEPFRLAEFPSNVRLEMMASGGHLGYISRRPWKGSRRWLDVRIETWAARRIDALARTSGRPDASISS